MWLPLNPKHLSAGGSQVPGKTQSATPRMQRQLFHTEINFISKSMVLICLTDTSDTPERYFDAYLRLLWPSFTSGPGLILMGMK